jgi:4-hydroxy-3-methylbut-2-en-1-yl diphosphate reductase
MEIRIDEKSGYCFGVEYAIQMAEDELNSVGVLYCLGDIVHNDQEVKRLEGLGLKVINKEELRKLRNVRVLIRAHGEPPETYKLALNNNIELIDASCPVVLKLQNRVKNSFDKASQNGGQLVIFGKNGHAEVEGLSGQTLQSAIVVSEIEDLEKIDFERPVTLYSQTTKSTKAFYQIGEKIKSKIQKIHSTEEIAERFELNDSICRQVSNREPQLERFSEENNVILFVAGKKSSNGKALFLVCKSKNSRSHFIQGPMDIDRDWFNSTDTVGICGATSTPMWLMEDVSEALKGL